MTRLRTVTLACRICGTRFTSKAVVTTNAHGGTQTDFRERAVGVQPLAYYVHTCGVCGYSGEEEDFAPSREVTDATRTRIWRELAPKLASGALTGSEKYELAARVALWQDEEPTRVAELLLCAAWCCTDEGDAEAERYFRRKSARLFEIALQLDDAVERQERAVLTYLVGELWRRIGDERRAREWFDRVPAEVTAPDEQEWILRIARRQRDDPLDWVQ